MYSSLTQQRENFLASITVKFPIMLGQSKWSFARSKFNSNQSPIFSIKAISLHVISNLTQQWDVVWSIKIMLNFSINLNNSTCFTNLPLTCEPNTSLFIYDKKSQRIFLSLDILSFVFIPRQPGSTRLGPSTNFCDEQSDLFVLMNEN